jgi:hypothetical protein
LTTTIVKAWSALPIEFVARIVIVELPTAVGVPLICPWSPARFVNVKPEGSEPETIE